MRLGALLLLCLLAGCAGPENGVPVDKPTTATVERPMASETNPAVTNLTGDPDSILVNVSYAPELVWTRPCAIRQDEGAEVSRAGGLVGQNHTTLHVQLRLQGAQTGFEFGMKYRNETTTWFPIEAPGAQWKVPVDGRTEPERATWRFFTRYSMPGQDGDCTGGWGALNEYDVQVRSSVA